MFLKFLKTGKDLESTTLLKMRLHQRSFHKNFAKIFKNIYFVEHLGKVASSEILISLQKWRQRYGPVKNLLSKSKKYLISHEKKTFHRLLPSLFFSSSFFAIKETFAIQRTENILRAYRKPWGFIMRHLNLNRQ